MRVNELLPTVLLVAIAACDGRQFFLTVGRDGERFDLSQTRGRVIEAPAYLPEPFIWLKVENPNDRRGTVSLREDDSPFEYVFRVPAYYEYAGPISVPQLPFRGGIFVDDAQSPALRLALIEHERPIVHPVRDGGAGIDGGTEFAQCWVTEIQGISPHDFGVISPGGVASVSTGVIVRQVPEDGSLPPPPEGCNHVLELSEAYGWTLASGRVSFQPVPYRYGVESRAIITARGPNNTLTKEVVARTEPLCPLAPGVSGDCPSFGGAYLLATLASLYTEVAGGQVVKIADFALPRGAGVYMADIALTRYGAVFGVSGGSVCEIGVENGVVRNCLTLPPEYGVLAGAAAAEDGSLVVGGTGLYRINDAGIQVLVAPQSFQMSGDLIIRQGTVYFTAVGLHSDELWRVQLDGGQPELVGALGFSGAYALRGVGDAGIVYTSTGFAVEVSLDDATVLGSRHLPGAWAGAADRP